MARRSRKAEKATSTAGKDEGPVDAISLLKADHRQVEELFEGFAKDSTDKSEIAAEVCRLLTSHARIEAEIFHPAGGRHSAMERVMLFSMKPRLNTRARKN